jgi:hypothetical protein
LNPGLFGSRNDGYEDFQIDSNTFQVSYLAESGATQTVAEKYALYRCAELTVQKGYDYFIIVEENADQQNLTHVNNGIPDATGVLSKTTVTTSTKHSVQRLIKVYKGSKPEGNPHAYNAREVMSYLEPKIKKK